MPSTTTCGAIGCDAFKNCGRKATKIRLPGIEQLRQETLRNNPPDRCAIRNYKRADAAPALDAKHNQVGGTGEAQKSESVGRRGQQRGHASSGGNHPEDFA